MQHPTQGLKILLVEGSSVQAREVLYALGPRHQIDIIDADPFCQARWSKFVHRWYRCPSYTRQPQEYLSFLLRRLDEGEYDVLFPTHEHVYLLSRFRDKLQGHVAFAIPDFDALHRVQSKAAFSRVLDELGLPQPDTQIASTREELDEYGNFPCFAKVDYSTAGNGVRLVESARQMQQVADEFAGAGWLDGRNEILLQQPAVGKIQSTFSALFQHGRLVASLCIEIRRAGVGGWGMSGVSANHPQVREHICRLGEYLAWHGPMFVDYLFDFETQQPQYIECNPRISGTLHTLMCGVDMADQYLRVARGEEVKPLPPGRAGIRYHHGFLMLLSLALEGANRRRLLREIYRAVRGEGFYDASEDTLTRFSDDWWSIVPAAAVSLSLLARPQSAQRFFENTVGNYSMPEAAARAIREADPEGSDLKSQMI